jgi:hypothetical protein
MYVILLLLSVIVFERLAHRIRIRKIPYSIPYRGRPSCFVLLLLDSHMTLKETTIAPS